VLEGAVYRNTIDGFVYLLPRAPVQTIRGAFPGFNYAQTNARLRGVELAAAWSPAAWLQLSSTGNLVRGANLLDGGPLYDMPADRVTAQARVIGASRALGTWHVGGGTVLVRRQDGVPDGIVYALPTAGYALMSAEFGSTGLHVLGQTVDLSVSAANLLNRRYRDYLSRYRLFVDDTGRDQHFDSQPLVVVVLTESVRTRPHKRRENAAKGAQPAGQFADVMQQRSCNFGPLCAGRELDKPTRHEDRVPLVLHCHLFP